MLKFHPFSILTGDTRVEFVIYFVLKARFFAKNQYRYSKEIVVNL
jgi:hypothetical protein